MSTFDIQSIAPEGYEVVDYRCPKAGEEYVSSRKKVNIAISDFSDASHPILRKKWRPKVGEVVFVFDSARLPVGFKKISSVYASGRVLCADRACWEKFRQLTPEERGE